MRQVNRLIDVRWRDLPALYRNIGGTPYVSYMANRIGRGIRTGYFWRWPIGTIIKDHARRCAYAVIFGAGVGVGYNQGVGQRALDNHSNTPQAQAPAIKTAAPIDPRCELELYQSTPPIWLASWKHEVRALSGINTRKSHASLADQLEQPIQTRLNNPPSDAFGDLTFRRDAKQLELAKMRLEQRQLEQANRLAIERERLDAKQRIELRKLDQRARELQKRNTKRR